MVVATDDRATISRPPATGVAAAVSQERPTPPLPRADIVVDATGLLCPGPIVELAKRMRTAAVGQIVEVIGTDPGILADAPAWAHQTGHALIGAYSADGRHRFWIRKIHT